MTHLEEMINHQLYLYDMRTQEYQNWIKAYNELYELKKENLELKKKLEQLKSKKKGKDNG